MWRDSVKFVVGLGALLLGVLDVYQFLSAEQTQMSPDLWVIPLKFFVGVVLLAEGGGSEHTKEYVSWIRSHHITQAIVLVYLWGFTMFLYVWGAFFGAIVLGLISILALASWLDTFTSNGASQDEV